ncbi:MAG: quinohemoprotein amine dehydrogenase subunit gamma [Gemmatimonadales bacterium]
MRHLRAVNQKATRIEAYVAHEAEQAALAASVSPDELDVVALRTPPHEQDGQPHFPLGCSLVFAPGWEVDSQGGTAGLCQPVERDLFDCHLSCFWPAHVPDQLNHAPDWTGKCASATKDWRNLDLVFP